MNHLFPCCCVLGHPRLDADFLIIFSFFLLYLMHFCTSRLHVFLHFTLNASLFSYMLELYKVMHFMHFWFMYKWLCGLVYGSSYSCFVMLPVHLFFCYCAILCFVFPYLYVVFVSPLRNIVFSYFDVITVAYRLA